MYELIIIPENPFSGTHYWCVHNFSAEVIHPNVSDLHILLLLVVLVVHSVVDLKLTWPKCCYTNVKNIKKNFDVNHHHHSISRLVEENSNRNDASKWNDVVDQKQTCPNVECWKYRKLSCQPQSLQHIISEVKKIPTEVIYPNLSDLPGLLLLVVLAVHSDVDHQTTWPKTRQEKDFWWTSKSSSPFVSGWGRVKLNQNCKIDCWLPFTISELAPRLSLRGP